LSFFLQLPYGLDTLFGVVLVLLLLRGPCRRYGLFSVYIGVQIVTHALVAISYRFAGFTSRLYRNSYWTDEIVQDVLLLLVVISFTYAALKESPLRASAPKLLAVIAAAALLLPFALLPNHHGKTHGAFDSQWFNHTSQILNFGAAIMNVVLWTALLTNRKRDPELVTLSIGVGILTSSAAIAWGARQWLSQANRWPVDIFMTIAHLATVILWCWLFRPKAWRSGQAVPPGAAPPNAPPDALTTPS
jgi:hypothetical protein